MSFSLNENNIEHMLLYIRALLNTTTDKTCKNI